MKRVPITEFRERGYLQELNRQFLHPLGLALEVTIAEDGSESISGVWDCRDDPEGIYFDPPPDADKSARIEAERKSREAARVTRLGYVIQEAE